jgi:hypothetical protein
MDEQMIRNVINKLGQELQSEMRKAIYVLTNRKDPIQDLIDHHHVAITGSYAKAAYGFSMPTAKSTGRDKDLVLVNHRHPFTDEPLPLPDCYPELLNILHYMSQDYIEEDHSSGVDKIYKTEEEKPQSPKWTFFWRGQFHEIFPPQDENNFQKLSDEPYSPLYSTLTNMVKESRKFGRKKDMNFIDEVHERSLDLQRM